MPPNFRGAFLVGIHRYNTVPDIGILANTLAMFSDISDVGEDVHTYILTNKKSETHHAGMANESHVSANTCEPIC